jgi:hypothetical protein
VRSHGVARRATACIRLILIDFQDAGRLNDGRSFLAFSKALGAFPIDIHPSKLLAIVIVDRDLPMAMFATLIALESGGPLALLFCHAELLPKGTDYCNFGKPAQVAS